MSTARHHLSTGQGARRRLPLAALAAVALLAALLGPAQADSPSVQQAQLTASDGAATDLFGRSVAITGDTAVVGAIYDNVGGITDQGSAYVFVRSGTTWTQQAKLTASDGADGDSFGVSVAISGDTAVVGAYADDVGSNANQGSAYVYVRSGTTWSQHAKLTASDGAADDQFGVSIAISGDTAVVGAYRDDVESNKDQGSAYVFVPAAPPTPTPVPGVTIPGLAVMALFLAGLAYLSLRRRRTRPS